jgi:hypothetical protein
MKVRMTLSHPPLHLGVVEADLLHRVLDHVEGELAGGRDVDVEVDEVEVVAGRVLVVEGQEHLGRHVVSVVLLGELRLGGLLGHLREVPGAAVVVHEDEHVHDRPPRVVSRVVAAGRSASGGIVVRLPDDAPRGHLQRCGVPCRGGGPGPVGVGDGAL